MVNCKNYYQGVYTVINKEKYLGNKNPNYRSSFESRFLYYLDNNKNVIRWGYENIIINYKFDIDNRVHRYIPDFYAEIMDKNGKLNKMIIEIKPLNQTAPPRKPKINNQKAYKRYMYESHQYIKNQNKWNATVNFCQQNGLIFKVVTEKDLF